MEAKNVFSNRRFLANQAFKSEKSRGRRKWDGGNIVYSYLTDPFLLDSQKILLSDSFRKLNGKLQVFPRKDYINVRDRSDHTREVFRLGTLMSDILGLNRELVAGIALGHDVGYPPFGKIGEKFLSEMIGKNFRHEIMGIIFLELVEDLGLSWEIIEGIFKHRSGNGTIKIEGDYPLEYSLLRFCDNIAILSDFEDAISTGYFLKKDLPPELYRLGADLFEWWDVCVLACFEESAAKNTFSFSESKTAELFEFVRQWAYENFYKKIKTDKDAGEVKEALSEVYWFLMDLKRQGLFSYEPSFAIALMSEDDVWGLKQFSKYPTIRDIKKIGEMGFVRILEKTEKIPGIFNFELDNLAKEFYRI
jgi:dGTPase